MIWIVSNGGKYSDHTFYFVFTSEGFDMPGYLTALEDAYEKAEGWRRTELRVVGTAPDVKWREEPRGLVMDEMKDFQAHYNVEGELSDTKDYEMIDLEQFYK